MTWHGLHNVVVDHLINLVFKRETAQNVGREELASPEVHIGQKLDRMVRTVLFMGQVGRELR